MRLTVLCLACVTLAGCGSSPTEPTQVPSSGTSLFSTAVYHVQISWYDFSSDPDIPACDGPIGVPISGKAVTVDGRARGDFRFSDSAGNTGRCSVVGIHINAASN